MGVNDIVELSLENETLKNPRCQFDEKWLQEPQTKLFKKIDDEKRATLFMSRKKTR